MGRLALALLLSLTVGCATTAAPQSLTALMSVQLRERAGMVPSDATMTGRTHEAALHRLQAWAERGGIVVALADLEQRNLRGSIQPGMGGWIILIDRAQGPDAQLYTLLHELAHLLGPANISSDDSEVIAEVATGMVYARLGLDVWPHVAAYLVWRVPSFEAQAAAVQRRGAAIDALVEKLTRATM